MREQYITGKGIGFVTLRITGIIHRLLSVVEKNDVTPIEVQIQMRQFVNNGEPEIIHAIMTEGQTNHWASIRGVKTSAIKVSLRQVLKDDKMNMAPFNDCTISKIISFGTSSFIENPQLLQAPVE